MMYRKFLTALMVVVLSSLLLTAVVQAQGPTLESISNLNVRTGPGASYAAIGTIPRGIFVSVEGRNQPGDWVLVHTSDGTLRGWVASRYLVWGDADVAQLAILDIEIYNPSASVAPSADITENVPEGSLIVGTVAPTYFRQGPGTGFPTLVMLPGGMYVAAESRSEDGNWVLGHTADESWRGWVLKDHIAPNEEVPNLEVSTEVIENAGIYQNFEARLMGYPVIPTVTERTRQIFAKGQESGMQRQVFTKVGDCHTDNEAFLLPFGVGEYTLGDEYANLQETIDYFSVSPRQGVANSFVNESMAANSAFNAAAIFDPVWANPTHCQSGEAPIECEYRMLQPSLAIVYFGSVDMQVYNVEDFAFHIRKLVEISIDRGVVPVLTTFASNEGLLWEKSLQFNAIILDIASEEQVPVINLWRSARALPNSGLEADNFHLSYDGTRWIDLTGEQNRTGIELRNFLTLQTLHDLQYSLLMQ